MAKKCVNCNQGGFGPDDNFCPECSSKLVDEPAETPAAAAKGKVGGVQQDNRIYSHTGDKTEVSGDSFSAQNVDKSTVLNTSTTTIGSSTTIGTLHQTTITDETKAVIKCAISGRKVTILESADCPQCGRTVALKYYNEDLCLCKICYEEKNPGKAFVTSEAAKHAAPAASSAPHASGQSHTEKAFIPPMVGGSSGYAASQPVVEPIKPGGGKKKGKGGMIAGILVAVVAIIVAVIVLKPGGGDKDATKTDKTEVAANAGGGASKPATTPSAGGKTAGSTTPSSGTATTTTPGTTTAKTPEKAAPPKVNAFDEGKKAFDEGNFAKANVFFGQAITDNTGSAGANYYLAKMYSEGKGVGKSARNAFTHMQKAAEGGYPDAYYDVAEMYRIGMGTEQNKTIAKTWYEKAVTASAKNADKASAALGRYYR